MNLQLPLIRKWFGLTKERIKSEDYRELNLYWFKRFVFKPEKVIEYYNLKTDEDVRNLCSSEHLRKTFLFKPFKINRMTLGYPKSDDKEKIIDFEHKGIEIRTGSPEWGAEPDKLYFVILHGSIIE